MDNETRSAFKKEINGMGHVDLARMYRFGKSGDPIIQDSELFQLLYDRFQDFGGMTPEISKEIGWV